MCDEALVRWHEHLDPFLDEALELGCVVLDELFNENTDDVVSCNSILLYRQETFLDFLGHLVGRRRMPGISHGFVGVQFRTFKGAAPELRQVYTQAQPEPGPPAPGLNAWLTRRLVLPILNLFPLGQLRPFPLRQPGDLTLALERHYRYVDETPGELWRPGGDPLEWRYGWFEAEQRDA